MSINNIEVQYILPSLICQELNCVIYLYIPGIHDYIVRQGRVNNNTL